MEQAYDHWLCSQTIIESQGYKIKCQRKLEFSLGLELVNWLVIVRAKRLG